MHDASVLEEDRALTRRQRDDQTPRLPAEGDGLGDLGQVHDVERALEVGAGRCFRPSGGNALERGPEWLRRSPRAVSLEGARPPRLVRARPWLQDIPHAAHHHLDREVSGHGHVDPGLGRSQGHGTVSAGEQEKWRVHRRRILPDEGEQLVAVHVLDLSVAHDEVRALRLQRARGRRAARGGRHLIAGADERPRERRPPILIRIHEEHFRHSHGRNPSRAGPGELDANPLPARPVIAACCLPSSDGSWCSPSSCLTEPSRFFARSSRKWWTRHAVAQVTPSVRAGAH